jgi:maltose alpha-D-glucosyltransferase/alpha-amylase
MELLAARSRRAGDESAELKELMTAALAKRGQLGQLIKQVVARRIDVDRIRCHGDYHLGQVLFTGKDFVILDFEGEPGRTLAERRFKRCVLRDVAGMIRSFDYARVTALQQYVSARDREVAQRHSLVWYGWCVAGFLRAYLGAVEGSRLVPAARSELELLLDFYTVEKCLYELNYELNNRPDWVQIPLAGLLQY